jgi:hypothetical protein
MQLSHCVTIAHGENSEVLPVASVAVAVTVGAPCKRSGKELEAM